MKNKLLSITVLFISLLLTSCNEKEAPKEVGLKTASLSIEGMTCEIGCARTIQSKLSKTEGVNYAQVNFDKKSGTVEYDANKITEKQLVAIVEQIADGDLYKVTKITGVE